MAVMFPLEDKVWVTVNRPDVAITKSMPVIPIAISAPDPTFLSAVFLLPWFVN